MAIRHVVTITVAAGKAREFVEAFAAMQALAKQDEGCEQYELFQSLDDPHTVVLMERWVNEELLARHMEAERARNSSAVDTIVALWAPGTTPTVERFEV
jgi:quinol monooxygenase YgiN